MTAAGPAKKAAYGFVEELFHTLKQQINIALDGFDWRAISAQDNLGHISSRNDLGD